MDVYFSPSSVGFIPEQWRTDGTYTDENWPQDAVLLTHEESDAYWRANPPGGKQLGSTSAGRPCWVDVPAPSHDELVAQAEAHKTQLQREAEEIIKPLERAKQLDMITADELKRLTAWERYSVLLMRVDTSTAPDVKWPTLPTV